MSEIVNALVPVEKIFPHQDNYNQHPDSQIAQLEASYQELGQYNSIVLWARPDGTYTQVARHGFLEAAKNKGATEIRADILPIDTDPLLIKRIMAADNLHAQNSQPDEAMLAALLQEQVNAGYDLAALGTDEETLRQMLESLGDEVLASGKPDIQFKEYDESIADELDTELCKECGKLCMKSKGK
jgi:ParB-like chromosome segregation protein Spo0J